MVFISNVQNSGNTYQLKTAEERAEQQSQKLTKDLSLSADQTAKIKPILLDHEQKADQIKTKYKRSQDKTAERKEMETGRQYS